MTTAPVTTAPGSPLPGLLVENVRAEDITTVALILRDPNPIHFDLDAVARAGLGDRPVNQGGSTMAYVMNMLIAWAGSRSAIRRISCTFRSNVFAGDDVEVGGTVTEAHDTDSGVLVECDVWADVVGGPRAIAGTATVLLPGAPTP
ncbi:MaoC family dehydratase [Nocardioides sp. NPDC057767]|uniref:MaoC family dehydratase n=1 Tax=unclassified Nocardioides TaxID=2615069 RepID=UPI0036735547